MSYIWFAPTRCCKWVEENAEGQRVLDYGSGSGILGLAALSLGAIEVALKILESLL